MKDLYLWFDLANLVALPFQRGPFTLQRCFHSRDHHCDWQLRLESSEKTVISNVAIVDFLGSEHVQLPESDFMEDISGIITIDFVN